MDKRALAYLLGGVENDTGDEATSATYLHVLPGITLLPRLSIDEAKSGKRQAYKEVNFVHDGPSRVGAVCKYKGVQALIL